MTKPVDMLLDTHIPDKGDNQSVKRDDTLANTPVFVNAQRDKNKDNAASTEQKIREFFSKKKSFSDKIGDGFCGAIAAFMCGFILPIAGGLISHKLDISLKSTETLSKIVAAILYGSSAAVGCCAFNLGSKYNKNLNNLEENYDKLSAKQKEQIQNKIGDLIMLKEEPVCIHIAKEIMIYDSLKDVLNLSQNLLDKQKTLAPAQ